MKYFKPLLAFFTGLIVLLLSQSFHQLSLINALAQVTLFAIVVCWPIWKTGRMSYVDIGWPWGLVCIGLVTILFGDGYSWRVWVVGGIYLFIGGRMGIFALRLWAKGHLNKEFPRYQYQRIRWEKKGKTNVQLAMQVDALAQGLANASFLAIPAFIISSNPDPHVSVWEIIGLLTWVLAFIMETVADSQKARVIQRMKAEGKRNQVCDVGLWQYSRHPNYFAEWMVWNGLVIATIPSYIALMPKELLVIWILMGIGLVFVSRIMYLSLVYLTGAVPSEYYSAKKRPDYEAYQKRVNRFFPGLPKKTAH